MTLESQMHGEDSEDSIVVRKWSYNGNFFAESCVCISPSPGKGQGTFPQVKRKELQWRAVFDLLTITGCRALGLIPA